MQESVMSTQSRREEKWRDYIILKDGVAIFRGHDISAVEPAKVLSSGRTYDEVLKMYPSLTLDHLAASMDYVVSRQKDLSLINATHDRLAKSLSCNYSFKGYRRIRFYHIPKTGGSSVNQAFLGCAGDSDELYYKLCRTETGLTRIIHNGYVFIGWVHQHMENGDYFYAFSHDPVGWEDRPDQTFAFTVFRDPVKRILSHYTMLREFEENGEDGYTLAQQGDWLGSSIRDFARNMPRKNLHAQLHMFSPRYDIDEACAAIGRLNYYFCTERFSDGVAQLSQKLGLPLAVLQKKKARTSIPLSNEDIRFLTEMLEPEYRLFEKVGIAF